MTASASFVDDREVLITAGEPTYTEILDNDQSETKITRFEQVKEQRNFKMKELTNTRNTHIHENLSVPTNQFMHSQNLTDLAMSH